MDRLSACYFCGAATVGDQGRVRVAGDETATVTLCGDCTDKLDRLAGAASVALSLETGDTLPGDRDARRSPTETANTGTGPPGGTGADGETAPDVGEASETDAGGERAPVADVDDPESATGESGDAAADTPGIPDDAQIFTDDAPDDPTAASRETGRTDSTDSDPDDPTDDPAGRSSDDGAGPDTAAVDDRPLVPSDGDETDVDRSFATSQAAGGRRETSHDPRGRRSDRRSSPSDADTTDAARSDPGPAGSTPGDDDGGAAADAVPDGTRDDDRGSEDGDTGPTPADVDVATVPRETYNKVVRLLQNRTFPVERDTVVSVATSAYGLSRRNCDATLDALVEHGVLEESEDGERLLRT